MMHDFFLKCTLCDLPAKLISGMRLIFDHLSLTSAQIVVKKKKGLQQARIV